MLLCPRGVPVSAGPELGEHLCPGTREEAEAEPLPSYGQEAQVASSLLLTCPLQNLGDCVQRPGLRGRCPAKTRSSVSKSRKGVGVSGASQGLCRRCVTVRFCL